MAYKKLTNVMQSCAAPGVGNFAALSAIAGRDTFGARCANGDTFDYMAMGVDANGVPTGNWEQGDGTWDTATTSIVRGTVNNSSNADAGVNFTDANVFVFAVAPPFDLVFYEENGGITLPASAATPIAPATGFINIFAKIRAGRYMVGMVGPLDVDTTLQPFLGGNAVVAAFPNGNSTTLTYLRCALTATGTATAANWANTSLHTQMKRIDYLVTTAATTAVAGYRGAAAQFSHGNAAGRGGFFYVCRFSQATGTTTASRRSWDGLIASAAAPTDVNPSTLLNALGVGYATADTNFQIMYNGASGTATKVDTGIPKQAADRATMYELAMFCAPNSQTVYWSFTDLGGTTVATGSFTSPIANNIALNTIGYCSAGGTSSVIGKALAGLYVETDS